MIPGGSQQIYRPANGFEGVCPTPVLVVVPSGDVWQPDPNLFA